MPQAWLDRESDFREEAAPVPQKSWIFMSKEESRRRRAIRERRLKTYAKYAFVGATIACVVVVVYLTL
tara:strand:+ start:288 stop:491 length:204 start_codon:yes stop_codon:yes gene_type:complete